MAIGHITASHVGTFLSLVVLSSASIIAYPAEGNNGTAHVGQLDDRHSRRSVGAAIEGALGSCIGLADHHEARSSGPRTLSIRPTRIFSLRQQFWQRVLPVLRYGHYKVVEKADRRMVEQRRPALSLR